MNWYLETELHYGTTKWDILMEGFLLTFYFEDEFVSIDESLQEIKVVIFIMPQEPMEWIQPDWSTQLCHALECYNVTVEEEDEYMRNINIPKAKGHREVKGPQIYNPDITASLKTKKVNIGTEVEPKFAKIGDYRNDATMYKVAELLREYQDIFPTKFSNLKGIIGDLRVMKNTLKMEAKPIKKRPYRLNPKYKEMVCL